EQEQLAQGREADRVDKSLEQLAEHVFGGISSNARGQHDQVDRGDRCQVAESVNQEAITLSYRGDHEARDRRPDQTGEVELRGVERDGVAEVVRIGDELPDDRLP